MTEQDLNDVIAGFREALRDYVKGDPEPAMSFFSDRDDVTLANPLEPPRRGPAEVGEAGRRAAANFQEGGPLHFEEVSSSFEERPGRPRSGTCAHRGLAASAGSVYRTVSLRVPLTSAPCRGASASRRAAFLDPER